MTNIDRNKVPIIIHNECCGNYSSADRHLVYPHLSAFKTQRWIVPQNPERISSIKILSKTGLESRRNSRVPGINPLVPCRQSLCSASVSAQLGDSSRSFKQVYMPDIVNDSW